MSKQITVISNNSGNRAGLSEMLAYKDLLFLLVRRDFVKEFKQTILGPLWFIIQPIFQTLVFLFVFGKIGGLGPNGIPQISFYLSGTLLWNLFSETLLKTSETFRTNAPIFGKVYFPRLLVPISIVFTNYLKLGVQLIIFLAIYIFEMSTSSGLEPNAYILLFPLFIVLTSFLGLGLGLIVSSLTTKYWDLRFLVQFAIQLIMFLSTVVTPYTVLQNQSGWLKNLIMLNPMSPYIEMVRFSFLGANGGTVLPYYLLYSIGITIFTLIVGIGVFNRVEKNFIDTV